MIAVADASVWTSALVAEDAHHSVSVRWVQAWSSAGNAIAVPMLALPEVGGAVARRTRDTSLGLRAIANIELDPSVLLIELDRELIRSSALWAAELFLRGSDAVYVALADRLGAPLITWDSEQRTRTASVIQATSPSAPLQGP